MNLSKEDEPNSLENDSKSIISCITCFDYPSNSKEIRSLISCTNVSFFFCFKCKETFLIQFEDMSNIRISCNCSNDNNKYKSLSIKDFLNKEYLISDEEENDNLIIQQYLECNRHKNKYKYYCLNEKINMCETCLKGHNCNNIKNLDDERYNLTQEIIPNIARCLIIDNNEVSNFDDCKLNMKNEYLRLLISHLVKQYYIYPDYNIIVNIKNFYQKMNNINEQEKKMYEINNNIEIKSQIL